MPDTRPWYREPETFIAVTALIVSVSAVVVGIYEANLQRRHDRAEVWPHVELSTVTSAAGATLSLENGGIGPAIMQSVTVHVDGKVQHNWEDVLRALNNAEPEPFSHFSVTQSALRAGDHTTLLVIAGKNLPAGFWPWIARVSLSACYTSVFGDAWTLDVAKVGSKGSWRVVDACPAQADGVDF